MDDGARHALEFSSKSLLPIGILEVVVGQRGLDQCHALVDVLGLDAAALGGVVVVVADGLEPAIERLLLIKKMKPLGFTLEEMRSLLTLRDELMQPDLEPSRRVAYAEARSADRVASSCLHWEAVDEAATITPARTYRPFHL